MRVGSLLRRFWAPAPGFALGVARAELSGTGGVRAFSLVEVTIALGVCAFALVSLLSLMPVGLNSAKHAMEITRVSKAFQQIAAEVSQSRFASIPAAGKDTWTFDFNGNPPAAPEDVFFTVRRRVVANITLPGASAASPGLVRVVFEMSSRGDQNGGPKNAITIADFGY